METNQMLLLKEQLKFKHLIPYPTIYKNEALFWSNTHHIMTQEQDCFISMLEFTIGSADEGDESWRITLHEDSYYVFGKDYLSIHINNESKEYIDRYKFRIFYTTLDKFEGGWLIKIPYKCVLWIGYN